MGTREANEQAKRSAEEMISSLNLKTDERLKVMKMVAQAISEITGWEWYEDVKRPRDLARIVRNFEGKGFIVPHPSPYPHNLFQSKGTRC